MNHQATSAEPRSRLFLNDQDSLLSMIPDLMGRSATTPVPEDEEGVLTLISWIQEEKQSEM